MVLHGQIEKAVRNEIADKVTKLVSVLWQLVLSDKTRPAAYRSNTFFVTYMGDEKFKALFPGGSSDAEDAQVTMLASELAPSNAMIKLKGTLLKGWLKAEELAKVADAADAPAQVAGVKVDRPNAKGSAPTA